MKLAAFSIILILLLGCVQPSENTPDANMSANTSMENNAMPGGDADEHGCIGSAGYTWCQLRNECLRVWETPCRLSLEEALSVAWGSDCMDEGRVTGDGAFFNNNSKTWWLTLEANKTGCNPACVVHENRSTEINWRCTGLSG